MSCYPRWSAQSLRCLAIFLHFESFHLVVPHRQLLVPLKGQAQEFGVDLAREIMVDHGDIMGP